MDISMRIIAIMALEREVGVIVGLELLVIYAAKVSIKNRSAK